MNGLIILCLKKSAYSTAAFNLALSIKYFNPNIHITLVSDGSHEDHYGAEHYSVFDWIKEIKPDDFMDNGVFQPAKAKLNINKYSMYEQSLYIDADSLCLQDIQPLFDKLKHYEFKSNEIEGYTQWTDDSSYFEFFQLHTGKTINSSWYYWENPSVFKQAQIFYHNGFPIDKVKPVWGGTYPDELFFNGAINRLSIDPKVDFDVMFFGNNIDERRLDEIEKAYYFFTLYGNKTTVRKIYQDFYDRLIFKFAEPKGLEHKFKAHQILVGKHVNR